MVRASGQLTWFGLTCFVRALVQAMACKMAAEGGQQPCMPPAREVGYWPCAAGRSCMR